MAFHSHRISVDLTQPLLSYDTGWPDSRQWDDLPLNVALGCCNDADSLAPGNCSVSLQDLELPPDPPFAWNEEPASQQFTWQATSSPVQSVPALQQVVHRNGHLVSEAGAATGLRSFMTAVGDSSHSDAVSEQGVGNGMLHQQQYMAPAASQAGQAQAGSLAQQQGNDNTMSWDGYVLSCLQSGAGSDDAELPSSSGNREVTGCDAALGKEASYNSCQSSVGAGLSAGALSEYLIFASGTGPPLAMGDGPVTGFGPGPPPGGCFTAADVLQLATAREPGFGDCRFLVQHSDKRQQQACQLAKAEPLPVRGSPLPVQPGMEAVPPSDSGPFDLQRFFSGDVPPFVAPAPLMDACGNEIDGAGPAQATLRQQLLSCAALHLQEMLNKSGTGGGWDGGECADNAPQEQQQAEPVAEPQPTLAKLLTDAITRAASQQAQPEPQAPAQPLGVSSVDMAQRLLIAHLARANTMPAATCSKAGLPDGLPGHVVLDAAGRACSLPVGAQLLPHGLPESACHTALSARLTSVTGTQTALSRQRCLERYRLKKARRLYTKKIRYHMRKVNADKRPRVKGRFVKAADMGPLVQAAGQEGVAEEMLLCPGVDLDMDGDDMGLLTGHSDDE